MGIRMLNAAAVALELELELDSRLAVVERVVAKEVRAWATREREFSGSGPESRVYRTSGRKRWRAMVSSVGALGDVRRMERKHPAAILPRPRSPRQSSMTSRQRMRSG